MQVQQFTPAELDPYGGLLKVSVGDLNWRQVRNEDQKTTARQKTEPFMYLPCKAASCFSSPVWAALTTARHKKQRACSHSQRQLLRNPLLRAGSCLARVPQVEINTCPGLLGDSPSSAAQNTARRAHCQQFLVIRANIQLAEAGTDQSFLKSSQGVGGHRIWSSLNDSQFGSIPYEAKLPEAAGVWPKRVLRILKIIILHNYRVLTALCAGLRWAPSCSEHKSRVQHAHLQYSLEILPWGW